MPKWILALFSGYLAFGGLLAFVVALVVLLGGPLPVVAVLAGTGIMCWLAALRVGYAALATTPAVQQSAPRRPVWLGLTGLTLGVTLTLLSGMLDRAFRELGLGPYTETVVALLVAGSLALGALGGFNVRVDEPG